MPCVRARGNEEGLARLLEKGSVSSESYHPVSQGMQGLLLTAIELRQMEQSWEFELDTEAPPVDAMVRSLL